MDINPKEALHRLRGLRKDHLSPSYRDVASNLMGQFIPDSGEYADAIIDLLERSDPDGWTDEQLREYGLIRLPSDKNGMPIHIEDVVYDEGDSEAWTVGYILLSDIDDAKIICETNKGAQSTLNPMFVTHHPPVTVDSLLRELTDSMFDIREEYLMSDMSESEFHKKMQELRDSYATKLRLTEE